MPSQDEHVAHLRRNYVFLRLCEAKCDVSSAYPDWLFIVRFYVCLHIVEAILAGLSPPQHSDRHSDRFTRISRLKSIFKDDFEQHFRDLYNTSYLARYSATIHKGTKTKILDQLLRDNEKSFNYIVEFAKTHFSITVEKPIPSSTSVPSI